MAETNVNVVVRRGGKLCWPQRLFVVYTLFVLCLFCSSNVVYATKLKRPLSGGLSKQEKNLPPARLVRTNQQPKRELAVATTSAHNDVMSSVPTKNNVLSVMSAVGMTLYGLLLLVYGYLSFHGQVYLITMWRSAGGRSLERAVAIARENYLEANRAAMRNAPSLYLANRSIYRIQHRIESSRKLLREIQKAKADGVVSAKEQRRISRMKRRQIRRLKEDARRIKRASSAVGRIIIACDIHAMVDICKSVLLTMAAILAAGHRNVGAAITTYCHFLNLGWLIHEVNGNIGFPFSRVIWTRELLQSDLDEEDHVGIAITGRIVSYILAMYLITFHKPTAFRLNAALMASAIATSGMEDLYHKKRNPKIKRKERLSVGRRVDRWVGTIMILLATVGMQFSRHDEINVPSWLSPLFVVEKFIAKMCNLVYDSI